jgi:hypothetical protein
MPPKRRDIRFLRESLKTIKKLLPLTRISMATLIICFPTLGLGSGGRPLIAERVQKQPLNGDQILCGMSRYEIWVSAWDV